MIPRRRQHLGLTAKWPGGQVQRLSGGVHDRLRGGTVVLNRHVVVPGRSLSVAGLSSSVSDWHSASSIGRQPFFCNVLYGCQLAMTVQLPNSFNASSVDETLSTNSCTNGQTSLTRDNSWVNEWPLLSDVLFVAVKVRAVANRYACACVV